MKFHLNNLCKRDIFLLDTKQEEEVNHMTIIKNVTASKIYMGKLGYGKDLLEEITSFSVKEDIRLGQVEALGAVQKARLGYYNQETREYQYFDLLKRLEITNLTGDISKKEENPMVHAHVTLADKDGNCYGGHLAPGTIIFACEVIIRAFDGPVFERGYEDKTGLPLWDFGDNQT